MPTVPFPAFPIPSMLCRHSCRSPRAAPAASLHIQTQRCLSRQPPQLSEHSCGSKFSAWKKIDRGLSTSIPHSPWQNVWFSMGASFVFCFIHQAAEIQLTHITLSVTPYKLQQDNAQSQSEILNIFRCAEPVRGLLKKKKKAPEEFLTILWKQEMRQRKKGTCYKCISLQLLRQML